MKAVDPGTGQGVPDVPVRSDNGILCHTRSNGEIAWSELSLMDRDVRFAIDRRTATRRRNTARYARRRAQIRLP